MSKANRNKTVAYGYVGEWADGTLGWCLPLHADGSVTKPEKCAVHPEWSNVGERSFLCRITLERIPNKRAKIIK